MIPFCAFNNCENFFGRVSESKGIVFHVFPSNERNKQQWIHIVRKQKCDPNWTPSKYCRICSLHFHPDDITTTFSGKKRTVRGSVPYYTITDKRGRWKSYHTLQDKQSTNKINEEDDVIVVQKDQDDTQVEIIVKDKQFAQDQVELKQNDRINNMAATITETSQSSQPSSKEGNPSDDNVVPLDKFKRRLVRAVARYIQQKKPEEEMWQELKKEIGCDCRMLWQHMRALTMKKLKRLLPANDFLANLKKIARFNATDWLLFDLILVHEKINVISINDGANDDENKEETQCLHDLFELVKEHKVEFSRGDDLIEAWIRVTLQYNSKGRQCSPMLLQLRWYQLKELTRARFYNFWCAYRGNHRLIDRAMKIKPTELQTAIAREYKNYIIEVFPEWEKLIEDRRVILSEEFTMNRELKRKTKKPREENDVELEVIEPKVETIELVVDSDEEQDRSDQHVCDIENSCKAEDKNKESVLEYDENNVNLNNAVNRKSVKSDSDGEMLELDGLSDVETMAIPLKKEPEDIDDFETNENSAEEISNDPNVIEILPKITSVVGNIVESAESEHELITMTENNVFDDVVAETNTDLKADIVADDINGIQCDSENDMDEILCEKANNFMKIELTQIKSILDHNKDISKIDENIESCEEIRKEDFHRINEVSRSINESSIQSDSGGEIDKLVEEKALSIEIPQIKSEQIEEASTLDSENIPGNEDANESSNNHDISEEEDEPITEEEEAIEKENQDDVFDDVEFDDEHIEYVDDGIEFIEEITVKKNKITELKEELISESEDESNEEDNNDNPQIDLKLLMDPVVYTNKLDNMDVFQFSDYECVNDKRVIECALKESKLVDKMRLKDEDIEKFREQAFRGTETDSTQSDNDIVQTFEENRVKCTSWLLQKPKNRSYNPIQLCKNPDFNTRLKRVTAGFLTSSRNRILLKECKPLTIDLHKAFENKLVNGTMYLKSGDFKSAKVIVAETIKNDTVSVLPSLIPGQNMIITTPIVDNNIATTSNKMDDRVIPNERSKIINLPDIDQVRRVNQSLLTAEVTPIRIDSKTISNDTNDSNNTNNSNNSDSISNTNISDNTNSCEETPKASDVQPLFVQPISVAPLIQIKDEPSELDLNCKTNLFKEANINQYENNSAKDLMAHKIHDQIITLSNQISEVDNNGIRSTSFEKTLKKQDKIAKKSKSYEKVIEKQKYYQQNKLTNVPLVRDKLTWTPKYPSNYIADSLLTKDTLVKILMLLNGNEQALKKSTSKQKKKLMELHSEEKRDTKVTNTTNEQEISEMKTSNTESKILSTSSNIISENTAQEAKVKPTGRGRPKKKITEPRDAHGTKLYTGIYCCWARERIINHTKNSHEYNNNHGCLKFKCQCCCRHELASFTTWKRLNNYAPTSTKTSSYKTTSNKVFSTIVLSDDDDISTKNIQSKEIVTDAEVKPVRGRDSNSSDINISISNVVTENLDNVALNIAIPPLIPITNTTVNIDANNIAIKNIPVQSEVNAEKLASDSHNLPLGEQNDLIKNQKSCKTVVHAAYGHIYNMRTESNNSTGSVSVTTKVDQPIEIKRNSKSNTTGRTLFLNSSQIYNRPTKSPVYLGKDKILLCSLKHTSVPQMPAPPVLPVLPYGVHFMMLPSGELSLSIDDGIQLDSEQLAALPSLMSIVQQQFLKSNISCSIAVNMGIPQTSDSVKCTEEIIETEVVTDSVTDNLCDAINASTECVNANPTNKEGISNGKHEETEVTNKNPNDIDGHSLTLSNDNGSIDAENIKQQAIVDTEVEREISAVETQQIQEQNVVEPQLIETHDDNIQLTESLKPAEPYVEPDQKANKISEDKKTIPRKTILSDLMEMSGICAEDTISDLTNEQADACPPVTPLPPTIIPVTRTSGSGIDISNSPTNSKMLQNISIAGPYSNLHSFEPNTPLNRLLNCVAQIRPELNAVTSFSELRYVYENDGQFFKLDINTGNISEIKVFIQKKPKKSQISAEPRDVIDLTDDTADDTEEVCAQFQDVSKETGEGSPIKPIKLFKAFHPSILRRRNNSVLKEYDVVYPRKAIQIKRQRRKQLLKLGNKYVLVDAQNVNAPMTSNVPPTSHLDYSFDSSDEEPLAKKSKRINPTANVEVQDVEDSSALFVDLPEVSLCESEEVVCVPEFQDRSGNMSDVDINSMDIEGVDPELHPVAFEEGSESDEDMCILGV